MLLGGEVRDANAAVWRTGEPASGEFARTAPVLAVEVCGEDEPAEVLLASRSRGRKTGLAARRRTAIP